MAAIEKIVTAVHHIYGEGALKDNVVQTTVYFNDGTSLNLDGRWMLEVGNSYRIEYTNGNPVTVTAVTMKL